jgi:hypothetical protein
MRKYPNSHREAKATAPVLDSTRHYAQNPPPTPHAHTLAISHETYERALRAGERAQAKSKSVDSRSGAGGRVHFAVCIYHPAARLTLPELLL